MTDEQILELAHRSNPTQHSYGFVKHTLLDFAHKLLADMQPNTQEPAAWINTAGKSTLLTTREPHEDYGTVVEHWFPLYTHPAPQQTQEPRKDTVFGGPKAREQMLNQLAHPAPKDSDEPRLSDLFCGVDVTEGMLSVSVLRRRSDDVAEVLHSEQFELPQAKPLTDEQIQGIMLANGFSIKDGLTDLKPYVYAAARAIEAAHGVKP